MKKHSIYLTLVAAALLYVATGCNTNKTPQLGTAPVDKVVSAMTLQEKAELVVGTGMHFEVPDSLLSEVPEQMRRMFNRPVDFEDSTYQAMVKEISQRVLGAAGRTAAFNRLGISTTIMTDGPAGMRIQPTRPGDTATYYCTAFPIATLLASSWDPSVVEEVGRAMGNEVHEYGADILLAPALNIQRNPLCGRNFEYYSEDPLIAGKMAAAFVNGVQSEGVGTSIKHFAANNQETNRNTVNTIVSQRALREIYLKGFRIAVQEGHPWTVMSSYNKINGTYSSENPDLLEKVLRDDWGFKGYVVTDWGGGSDPIAQMKAGNDLLMPGNPGQIRTIIEGVKDGKLDSTILDRNAERILNIVKESPSFKDYAYTNHPDLKAHAEVARKAATQGMILLENENKALPLSGDETKVAAFGTSSYETYIGGTGSGDVNEAYSVSVADGLSDAGKEIDESLKDTYLSYIKEMRATSGENQNWLAAMMGGKPPVAEMKVTPEMARKYAASADVAVITIGRNAGEGADRQIDGDFNLSNTEEQLIANVSTAFQDAGKQAIVVLNIDGVIETPSWRDYPDAILLAWQPGQEAGNAIADILTGKVNPSGKLAVTFPMKYEDEPSSDYFPGIELEKRDTTRRGRRGGFFRAPVPAEVVYADDIYVGYRYFSTFDKEVAYPFGYGLSYTTFKYENLETSGDNYTQGYTVKMDVLNTGDVAGKEIVELYLHAPSGSEEKPEEELKGFVKTGLLDPGETQHIEFVITPEDLASFDESRSAWVADAGDYEVRIGDSSLNTKLKATFTLDKEMVVRKVSNALAPNREIDRLHQ